MEFKGTKGKWSLYDFSGELIIESKESREYVLTMRARQIERVKIVKANALLISKAPEMLEMLQYFVENNMLSIQGEEMAKKLIKSATEVDNGKI